MTITRDHYSAASHPFDAATTAFSLDTSTTNASITLTEGVYEITNASSAELYVRVGATTASVMPPSSGVTTGVVGAWSIPAGASFTAVLPAGALHARIASGTGALRIHQKAVQ